MQISDFKSFIEYCNLYIKGDEKGEAHIFLNHFFMALGFHNGLKDAGAQCEFRIRDEKKNSVKFAEPQTPDNKSVINVAKAARELRECRNHYLEKLKMSLRDLYRTLDKPGKNPLKDLHHALDKAVIEAYGFDPDEDLLNQLLQLNLKIYENEQNGIKVQKPGIPSGFINVSDLISNDCIKFNPKID